MSRGLLQALCFGYGLVLFVVEALAADPLALATLSLPQSPIVATTSPPPQPDAEEQLLQGVLAVKQGDLEGAIETLEQLRQQVPNFHLAHLIYADLLSLRTGQIGDIGLGTLVTATDAVSSQRLNNLRSELLTRIGALLEPIPPDHYPRSLLLLDERHPECDCGR